MMRIRTNASGVALRPGLKDRFSKEKVQWIGADVSKRKRPPKMWIYSPRSAPKAKVPEAVKSEVSQEIMCPKGEPFAYDTKSDRMA
jgi:hypothetical protein